VTARLAASVNQERADPIGLVQEFVLRGRPAARASLRAAPEARAPGPAPDPDALRDAYLGLLKLALCDLAGTTTMSVGSLPGGGTASRVLRDDERRLRAAGMDWPLQGLTMIGLRRLDDLQSCVESVARDGVDGDLIEAGAWRGGAAILMRATLDSLGDRDRTVWVADSFQGFPEARDEDRAQTGLSENDFFAVPLEEVRDSFARFGCEGGVRFVPGFFEETLPRLSEGPWAIVRLDGDTYSATLTALESLYPALSPGGYLLVDDYGTLDECRRAVDEFRQRHEITEPLEEVDWTCFRWRRKSDVRIEAPARGSAPSRPDGAGRPDGPTRQPGRGVPTLHEVELSREVEALRTRLAAAEADSARLPGSALRAAAARLRGGRRRRS
jgi:O-methyltransferase